MVNNFNYGDRLKIHKATCGTLRPPKIGTGKLCGFDEAELIEDTGRHFRGMYRPNPCALPGRDCFGL